MQFPRREKITNVIVSCDKTIAYERIVNSIISEMMDLNPDYEHMEDLFELKHLCKDVDSAARNS